MSVSNRLERDKIIEESINKWIDTIPNYQLLGVLYTQ